MKNLLKQCWFCNEFKEEKEFFPEKVMKEIKICRKCDKIIYPDDLDKTIKKAKIIKFRQSKKLENKILSIFYNSKNNTVPSIKKALQKKGINIPIFTISSIISNNLKKR